MQAELIIYALVAAGLVFWLRNILGTRHGDERERPNPFNTPVADTPRDALTDLSGEDVISLPLMDEKPALPPNVRVASVAVESVLSDIGRQDNGFDVAKFSMAAQDAFAMIVEAFAAADRDTLKELLEPPVYAAFDSAIKDRESREETMVNQIHAVRSADIVEAKIDGRSAFVTIQFIAQETCVIKNKDGEVTFGHPDRVTEMNDVWTFARTLRSPDPKWLLHETRDGDPANQNLIPDSI